MSAAEKERVLRAWARFLQSGCKKTQFTKALYEHLIQHCSFIAHFDLHGFYGVYFEQTTPDVFRFLDQFDPEKPGISAEYGMTSWLDSHHTGADLNAAMREAAGRHVDRLRHYFQERHRQVEIAEANRLLARYGLTAIPASSTSIVTRDLASPAKAADLVQPALFVDR